jgi:mersacidin/lichenicidin family type 2 lantibiotic
MKKIDVIRAWKDATYRSSLTSEELAQLPVHPSGPIELRESDLREVSGMVVNTTALRCTEYSVTFRRCCP